MKSAHLWLMLYFLVGATLLALIVPPFEAPDEPFHLAYINFIASNASLPNQLCNGNACPEGHQPPLYYAVCAALVSALQRDHIVDFSMDINKIHRWYGGFSSEVPLFTYSKTDGFKTAQDKYAFYLLRMLSAVFGLLNLLFIWKIAKLFLGESQWALVPVIFAAALPQFLFISGIINNDSLANLMSTICIYCLFRILDQPYELRNYLYMGVSLGIGLLVKKSLLFMVPEVVLMLVYVLFQSRKNVGLVVRYAGVLMVTAAAICGWWFVRNQVLYGDLLGSAMERQTCAVLIDVKSLHSVYFLHEFPFQMFRLAIGCFGWANVSLANWVYSAYRIIIGSAAVGVAWYLIRTRLKDVKSVLAITAVIFCLAAIVYYNLTFTQPQGRFLFPVISMIGVLFALGWRQVLSSIRSLAVKRSVVAVLMAIMVASDVQAVIVILRCY